MVLWFYTLTDSAWNSAYVQQDDILPEAITSGNSAVRTIPGLDPAIHPPAKEMDPRVEPGVTDVMQS